MEPTYRAIPVAKTAQMLPQPDGPCVPVWRALDKVALCEEQRCELYDDSVALRWAASLVPAVQKLAPRHGLQPRDAPWYRDGVRFGLFVRGDWQDAASEPAACTRLEFVASAGALLVDVDDQGRPAPRYGCRRRLILETWAGLFDGSCVYPDGAEVGIGSGNLLKTPLELSAADERSLVYGGVAVTATPLCRWSFLERAGCPVPSCRTCDIVLEVHEVGGFGGAVLPPRYTTVTDSACDPCPSDPVADALPRLTAILGAHPFFDTTRQHDALAFFRFKEDCDAYVHAAHVAVKATGR